MGNCLQERKERQIWFSKFETQKIENLFQGYVNRSPITQKQYKLNESSFKEIFEENQNFGTKFFNFVEKYGKCKDFIPLEILSDIIEVFIKGQFSGKDSQMKRLGPLELFVLISVQEFSCLDFTDYKNLNFPYLQVIEIIKDLMRIGLCSKKNIEQFDEQAVKSIVDNLFKSGENSLSWFDLIQFLFQKLPAATNYIKIYFTKKFVDPELNFTLPVLLSPSYILNQNWLMLLLMSNPQSKLNRADRLVLLYSNILHPGGFSTALQQITAAQLPSLLVIQHEDPSDDKQPRPQIFGAISNQRWVDSGVSLGTNEDCIFSLYPYYNVFQSRKDREALKNYQYLNAVSKDNQPIGIGFGGTHDGQQCRIWLDNEFSSASYVNNQDLSFEEGPLVQPYVKLLNITTIEIWGIIMPEENFDLKVPEKRDLNDPLLIDQSRVINEQDYAPELGEKQLENSNEEISLLSNQIIDSFYWQKKVEQEEEKQGIFYWQKSLIDDEDEDISGFGEEKTFHTSTFTPTINNYHYLNQRKTYQERKGQSVQSASHQKQNSSREEILRFLGEKNLSHKSQSIPDKHDNLQNYDSKVVNNDGFQEPGPIIEENSQIFSLVISKAFGEKEI